MSALHDPALQAAIDGQWGTMHSVIEDEAMTEIRKSLDTDVAVSWREISAMKAGTRAAGMVVSGLSGWARATQQIEVDKAEKEARRVAKEETRPVLLAVDGVLDALLGTSLDDLPRSLAVALADLLSFFPETAAEVEGLDQ